MHTTPRSLGGQFKVIWANATQVGVSLGAVVEVLDVVADISGRQFSILEDSLLDEFLLQATEKGFSNGIVPTVAAPTHARFEVVGSAKTPPVVTTVLRPLVRVDYGLMRMPAANSQHDGIQGKLPAEGRLCRPTR